MSGINAVIANHLKVFFRDMTNQACDKINRRNGFMNEGIILVSVVVKGNRLSIIGVNPGSGNGRSAKIAANIFNNGSGVGHVRFSVNIEPILTMLINKGFRFFERRPQAGFHLVKESSAKSMPEKRIREMIKLAPDKGNANAAFGNETMNMRIPFEIASEGMKHTDKTRSKGLRIVEFMKHPKNNAADRGKKAIQKRAIPKKELSKLFRNRKNAMPMRTVNKRGSHRKSLLDRIHVATGRTKSTMTAERNKFKVSTMRAGVHGATKSRITAGQHLIDIFNLGVPGLHGI